MLICFFVSLGDAGFVLLVVLQSRGKYAVDMRELESRVWPFGVCG